MKSWLISLLFLSLAFNAQAQEQVVRLQKGGTVWSILKDQGCTLGQIASLWPVVVRDSALHPRNVKTFRPETPIVLKRGCDGQLFRDLALLAENKKIKEAVASLSDQLEKNKAQGRDLGIKLKELEERLGDLYSGSRLFAVSGSTFLTGLLIGSFLPWIRKNFLNTKLETAETPLEFPRQVVEEHWGKKVVLLRREDPSICKVGYECPFCKFWISRPKNCKKHLRERHQNEGRFEWVFSERVADSP